MRQAFLVLAFLLLASNARAQLDVSQPAAQSSTKTGLTASVNVKATAGNVYGIFVQNAAGSICWVQLINSAGAGVLGTNVITSMPVGSNTIGLAPPSDHAWSSGFTAGIAVGLSTTATGAVACNSAGTVVVFFN